MTRLKLMLAKYGQNYVERFIEMNHCNCKTCAYNPEKGFCVNMVYEETIMPVFTETCAKGLIDWLNSKPNEDEVI